MPASKPLGAFSTSLNATLYPHASNLVWSYQLGGSVGSTQTNSPDLGTLTATNWGGTIASVGAPHLQVIPDADRGFVSISSFGTIEIGWLVTSTSWSYNELIGRYGTPNWILEHNGTGFTVFESGGAFNAGSIVNYTPVTGDFVHAFVQWTASSVSAYIYVNGSFLGSSIASAGSYSSSGTLNRTGGTGERQNAFYNFYDIQLSLSQREQNALSPSWEPYAVVGAVLGAGGTPRNIEGGTLLESTGAGQYRVEAAVAGGTLLESTAAGLYRVEGRVEAGTILESTVAGQLRVEGRVEGGTVIESTVAGQLRVEAPVAGGVILESTGAGLYRVEAPVVGGTVIESTVSGEYQVQAPGQNIEGGTLLESTVAGQYRAEGQVAGGTVVESTAAGTYAVEGAVAGGTALESTVSGTYQVETPGDEPRIEGGTLIESTVSGTYRIESFGFARSFEDGAVLTARDLNDGFTRAASRILRNRDFAIDSLVDKRKLAQRFVPATIVLPGIDVGANAALDGTAGTFTGLDAAFVELRRHYFRVPRDGHLWLMGVDVFVRAGSLAALRLQLAGLPVGEALEMTSATAQRFSLAQASGAPLLPIEDGSAMVLEARDISGAGIGTLRGVDVTLHLQTELIP